MYLFKKIIFNLSYAYSMGGHHLGSETGVSNKLYSVPVGKLVTL